MQIFIYCCCTHIIISHRNNSFYSIYFLVGNYNFETKQNQSKKRKKKKSKIFANDKNYLKHTIILYIYEKKTNIKYSTCQCHFGRKTFCFKIKSKSNINQMFLDKKFKCTIGKTHRDEY